jgi:hypothetical protein
MGFADRGPSGYERSGTRRRTAPWALTAQPLARVHQPSEFFLDKIEAAFRAILAEHKAVDVPVSFLGSGRRRAFGLRGAFFGQTFGISRERLRGLREQVRGPHRFAGRSNK